MPEGRGRHCTGIRVAAAVALAVLCAGLASTARASPPVAAQEERHAQEVLAEIQRIDLQLNRASEAWDGARVKLVATERAVRVTRRDLARTQRQYRLAQRRLDRLLVALYVSDQPGALEVVLGATSMSDLLDRIDVAQRVSSSEAKVAEDVARLRERLRERERELQKSLRTERALVNELQVRRDAIQGQLSARRQLLSSIRSEIAQLKARERARERALAAQARARVAAQLRARLRAEQAARAQAARAKQAKAAARKAKQASHDPAPPPPKRPAPPPKPPPAPPDPTPPTTAAPSPPAPTAASPTPSPGSGHPEVVSIALRYLGVPYHWGGASPATGFDCSGFVMFVFGQIGISLPHYAAAQYQLGAPVGRDQLQPGDLVFFDGLSHVGIYIGAGQFVHSPHTGDVVRISSLSDPWYDAHYVGARRI